MWGGFVPERAPGGKSVLQAAPRGDFTVLGMAESAQGSQVLLELDLRWAEAEQLPALQKVQFNPAGMVCVPLGGVSGESVWEKE